MLETLRKLHEQAQLRSIRPLEQQREFLLDWVEACDRALPALLAVVDAARDYANEMADVTHRDLTKYTALVTALAKLSADEEG